MGIDARIYFKLKDGGNNIPKGFEIHEEDSEFKPEGATHSVFTMCRLYDFDYERGNFPFMTHLFMELFQCQDIEKIWYGGDYCLEEELPELTMDRFLELIKHYCKNGNRPYLNR